MLSNDGSHIVHATIADFNCVSDKNFVKFVVRWKLLLLQKKQQFKAVNDTQGV